MQYTNQWGLPDTIVRAVKRNAELYDKGAVDRSVTQLINAPQIDVLRRVHYSSLTKDVSDEFWALLGSAVHHILQMGATDNQIVEERLYGEVDGWAISGAIDVQEMEDHSVGLTDYKVCSIYVLQKENGNPKWEWEAQQNIYAYLMKTAKGIDVDRLSICAIIRDWSRAEAKRDAFYPQAPVLMVPLPVWSFAKQEAFIKERIALHRHAEMLYELDQPLPECTQEERWEQGAAWLVKKPDAKRASRVFETEKEALDKMTTMKPGYVVERRVGRFAKCDDNFCGVAEWCQQWKETKKDVEEVME